MHRQGLALAIAAAVLAMTGRLASEDERRDGNWWTQRAGPAKLTYVTGFFDGMNLGHDFSYWRFVSKKASASCLAQTDDSFNTYSTKYFSHVTNDQISDGFNEFYSDYR